MADVTKHLVGVSMCLDMVWYDWWNMFVGSVVGCITHIRYNKRMESVTKNDVSYGDVRVITFVLNRMFGLCYGGGGGNPRECYYI